MKRPTISAREQVRIGRVHAERFPRDATRTKAEYLAQLHAIRAELYPGKLYPGERAQ